MIVKFKPTGQLGTIDDKEFDPNIYEQVQQPNIKQQPIATATAQINQPQKVNTPSTDDPLNPLNDYIKRVGYTPQQIMEFKRKDLQKGIPRANVEAYYKTYDPTEQEASAISQYEKNKYKKNVATQGVDKLIDTLEGHYIDAKGGAGAGIGQRISGAQKDIAGALGYNDSAQAYNNERAAMVATLKSITGDTGVLTEDDAKRLIKLLPPLGATTAEAQKAFTDIRTFIANKTGGKPTQTKFTGQTGDAVQQATQAMGGTKMGFDFGQDKGQEAYTYIQQANELAKQSLVEKDPAKKAALLAKSRALADIGLQTNQQRTVNPIVAGGAQAQEFLGNSEALPLAASAIGSTLIPIPGVGAGAGAYLGEKGKNLLKQGGLEAFIPNAEKDNEALKNAIPYALADILFKGAGKVLQPLKTVGGLRSGAIKEAEAAGKVISGDKVVEGVKQWAETVPTAYRKEALSFLEEATKKFGGKTLSIGEGVAQRSGSYDIGYLLTKAARGAEAAGERVVGSAIKSQLPQNVAKYDKLFSFLFNAGKTVKRYGPPVVGATAGAGVLGGLLNKFIGSK